MQFWISQLEDCPIKVKHLQNVQHKMNKEIRTKTFDRALEQSFEMMNHEKLVWCSREIWQNEFGDKLNNKQRCIINDVLVNLIKLHSYVAYKTNMLQVLRTYCLFIWEHGVKVLTDAVVSINLRWSVNAKF